MLTKTVTQGTMCFTTLFRWLQIVPRLTLSSIISPKRTQAYLFLMTSVMATLHLTRLSLFMNFNMLFASRARELLGRMAFQISSWNNHLQSLLLTFNIFFNNDILPSSWKHAAIVPNCKPWKPPHSPHFYRPIALTSASCKVFKRMLLCRLLSWCVQRNFFPRITMASFLLVTVHSLSLLSSMTSLPLDLATSLSLRFA